MTRPASIARGGRNGWRALAAVPVAFAAAGDVAIFNEFRAQHEGIERPVGVAYRTDGSLAVLEADRPRVRILDSGGNEIGRLGEGRLEAPTAIVAWPDGSLVVADRGRDEVVAFAGDGSVQTLV